MKSINKIIIFYSTTDLNHDIIYVYQYQRALTTQNAFSLILVCTNHFLLLHKIQEKIENLSNITSLYQCQLYKICWQYKDVATSLMTLKILTFYEPNRLLSIDSPLKYID